MGNDHSKINRILIFGNGNLYKQFLKEIRNDDYVVGVDRAAFWLLTQGVVPDLAIGDFDSASRKEFQIIKKSIKNIQKYLPEKDQTDMELAVRYAMNRKPAEVLIFGGVGTRIDHTQATWNLLELLLDAKIPHSVIDRKNRLCMIGRGRTILYPGDRYRYVSVIPFTLSITLKLTGFRYNLPKSTITRGSTRTISNELTGSRGIIEILAGKAWVAEAND